MISWLLFDDDETRGIKIMKKEANGAFSLDRDGNQVLDAETTDQVKSALQEFLVCLGTYCPENFMYTVVNESTSYNWVMNKIKSTFKLDSGHQRLGLPRWGRHQD